MGSEGGIVRGVLDCVIRSVMDSRRLGLCEICGCLYGVAATL